MPTPKEAVWLIREVDGSVVKTTPELNVLDHSQRRHGTLDVTYPGTLMKPFGHSTCLAAPPRD